ncbi:MAG: ABC transporter ATP-binding protein [Thermoanaerobaculia bacterium]
MTLSAAPTTPVDPAAGAGVLLSVSNLSVAYGGIRAVKGISFDVAEGEIVTLIGANGAGKSSTLRALSGLVPCEGEVVYRGAGLRGVEAHVIVTRGIAHVPEGRHVFGNLTVKENLRLATWSRRKGDELDRDLDGVFALFPVLAKREQQRAGTLSGGEQQMLALGRALMTSPRLLLLDEPSMGLAPLLVREIFAALVELNRKGVTILLVEQNANMALHVAHRAYLLETGTIALTGTSKELLSHPRVLEAYLGAAATVEAEEETEVER